MVTRILDIAVLLLLATAILLPKADARIAPVMRLSSEDLVRVAELETRVMTAPDDAAAALELSDWYLDGRRPDGAIVVASRALDRAPSDHRLWGRRALALAEHFEAGAAWQSVERAVALCEGGSSSPCGSSERMRLTFLRDALATVKDLDMRKDPNTARERLVRALRPAYLPAQPSKKAP